MTWHLETLRPGRTACHLHAYVIQECGAHLPINRRRWVFAPGTFRCPDRFVCRERLSYSSMVHEGLFFRSSIASSKLTSPYSGLFFRTDERDAGGLSGEIVPFELDPLICWAAIFLSLCRRHRDKASLTNGPLMAENGMRKNRTPKCVDSAWKPNRLGQWRRKGFWGLVWPRILFNSVLSLPVILFGFSNHSLKCYCITTEKGHCSLFQIEFWTKPFFPPARWHWDLMTFHFYLCIPWLIRIIFNIALLIQQSQD